MDARVWHYEVGGANVLSRWFSSRKAVPGGKRSSALDAIVSTSWEPEWTSELIEILSVLTRLVEKEDEQAEILAGVISGPVFTMHQLSAAGVDWPTMKKDRLPRLRLSLTAWRALTDLCYWCRTPPIGTKQRPHQ